MPDRRTQVAGQWNIGPAMLAWLVPGLGHWLVGEYRRALILGTCIGCIWLAGLLIGGLSVIDRQQHPAWFVAQVFTAPSVVVQYCTKWIQNREAHRPSFGRMREHGILYTALAGLLNLLAMIDLVYYRPPLEGTDAVEDRV